MGQILARFFPKSSVFNSGFISILAVCCLLACLVGMLTDEFILFALPAALLVLYISVVDFKKLFYLLFFMIPFTTEVEIPGGLQLDLPGEPLTIGLMLIYSIYLLFNAKSISKEFFTHPITKVLVVHFLWIFVTTLISNDLLISVKFLLAKSWYVITFYFLAAHVLKGKKEIQIFFWGIFIAILLTIVVITLRHALVGFRFDKINKVVGPFYRNKVAYASILSVFLPLVVFIRAGYRSWHWKRILCTLGILAFLMGIYLTYTRTAYLCVGIAFGAFFIVKYRLTKLTLGAGSALAMLGLVVLLLGNTYLDFAPEYKKTVAHKDFDSLISATAKGQDVSTMERVYRWVAAFQMIGEKPVLGFGPGTFYSFYKNYTVSSFSTYVSDNPEKSGVHCYYLMTAVEQGLIGLLIFLVLCFVVMLKGEELYHRKNLDPYIKRIVMAATLGFICIAAINIVNDMVETDKVGSFFFVYMALIVNIDIQSKQELSKGEEH
jgi:O-antigen ligase